MSVAVLGIEVNSQQATTAAASLNNFATAAGSAGSAADKLTVAANKAQPGIRGVQSAATPAAAATAGLEKAAKGAATAHAGLSTQAMAAGHSIRSMVEGIALGMPPTQVLTQQFGHLSYAASGPGGITGAFKEAGGALLGLLSPTTLVVGAFAAIGAASAFALNSIAKTEKQFDDVSAAVGITIGQLHGLAAAASFKGIDQAEFLKGMEKFGASVYDAQHNMGALAETFRANNVSAATFTQYLLKAGELIKGASSAQQRLQLLQQMGLPATMDWVRFLSQGAAGIRQAADEAVKFGGVADQALIAKARAFDEAWAKTWTNFKTGALSAFLGAGGYLDAFNGKVNQGLMSLGVNVGRNSLADAMRGGPTAASQLTANSDVSGFYRGTGAGLAGALKPTVDPNALKNQISQEQPCLGLLAQTPTAKQLAEKAPAETDKKEEADDRADRRHAA